MYLPIVIVIVFISGHRVSAQYADFRCKCICPSPTVIAADLDVIAPSQLINGPGKNVSTHESTVSQDDVKKVPVNLSKPQRSLYIANVLPQHCNCEWVVLPQLLQTFNINPKEFCPLCECKYESRNITTIRWIVTLSVGIILCLIIYMGYTINERRARETCSIATLVNK